MPIDKRCLREPAGNVEGAAVPHGHLEAHRPHGASPPSVEPGSGVLNGGGYGNVDQLRVRVAEMDRDEIVAFTPEQLI